MAEDGHLEGLVHFLQKNPFEKDEHADVNDVCDIKPYPQYKKEWARVRELYLKGKAEQKARPEQEVAPVDVELKGPSHTSYTYADDVDSTDDGGSSEISDSMDNSDSTDSSRYTDSGRSSNSSDSTDDESDSPPPVRRSKRLVKSSDKEYHAGHAPKLANVRRSKRLRKVDNDTETLKGRPSKRVKRSQESSDSEQDSATNEYNTSIEEASTDSSEGETTWTYRRVGNRARPVISDTTDDETEGSDPSKSPSSDSSSESEEEDNFRTAGYVGGRSRRTIQDTDDESDAAVNTRAASESSEEDLDDIQWPTRGSGRNRPVVHDSSDSSDHSDEDNSSEASIDPDSNEAILNVQDTVTGPVNSSGFVRRSNRTVAPRRYL